MQTGTKKYKTIMISLYVLIATVLILSITYAYTRKTLGGTKKYVITVAEKLELELNEETGENILMENSYPITDDEGMNAESYNFSLKNPDYSIDYDYTIYLVNNEIESTQTRVGDEFIKYYLTNDSLETQKSPALVSSLTTDDTGRILETGTIPKRTTQNYTLRFWIDYDATQEDVSGKTFSVKIKVIAQESSPTVSDVLFESEKLGDNCTTYNDGVDTFLVGQCSNNYVWYSGKLWRVVLKNNETGAVKMVTDNAITLLVYNTSENTAFKDSYMDQWLNQEFLPTLHDYEDYLVTNSVWNATEDSSDTPTRPAGTTTVERTVGLLNAYEYYTTYANSDGLATSSTTYLRNKVYWWLITPSSASFVRGVYSNGFLDSRNPAGGRGARPSVNLKSTIQTYGGTGIQSDPYILKGDAQETVNGTTLLSTRYSGEYVTFNNELYRIVDKETINGETLTKITAVDKPSALSSNVFDSDTSTYVTNFAEADIKKDLENYYQSLAITNETAYNMIQPSTTWYLGQVSSGENYKASICATVDASASMNACTTKTTSTTASIGLPRVGEMFTSQITRGTKAIFWTLTPLNASSVWYVGSSGGLGSYIPRNGSGARPSMHLKSTIKIASTNTGNGTYEKPYTIE